MFPSSVIRKLALSEEMLAETHNFVGLSAHLEGPIDVDALTDAFDLLLEAHPVLTARLERGADGRHELVADDLMHAGLEVVEVDASHIDNPPPHFDQGESLVHLRLFIRDGQAHPTLYVHHALADGHHMYGLIEELLSFYTDLVTNGKTGPVTAQPAPESIETVLADRGIHKGPRSGIERFMPALFAYDLPPSRRGDTGAKPASPVRVPMVSCRLSEEPDPLHRRTVPRREDRTALGALSRDPDRGVGGAGPAEHPGTVHLHRRPAVLPVAAGVGDRVHQPGGAGHLSRRDQSEDHGGRACPRHRRDVQGRPGRAV